MFVNVHQLQLQSKTASYVSNLYWKGGSNYLCLPEDPEFLATTYVLQVSRSFVPDSMGLSNETFDSPHAWKFNVPCSTCHTSARGDAIMIPGKISCMHQGVLMATSWLYHYHTSFECVDVNAESVPGSACCWFVMQDLRMYVLPLKCLAMVWKCDPYTLKASSSALWCAPNS